MKQLPDVPAIAETLPGFEAAGWYGFFATAGTPPAVLQKLNASIVQAVSAPDISGRIESMGLVPAPQSLDEAARFVAAEAVKWSRAVKASGTTVD
jgi:tripartite-type tricarboxylate transporter receptor subunit TctC